jgi:Putative Flp pilus-assembly TadE/G-like
VSSRRCDASSERGQTIVITVLFLGVLIGMAGLVIDVGSWYVQREKAQAAADFGALAAAAKLPNPAAATAAGEDYVGRNLADATAEVDPAFEGDPSKAEVRARTRGETFFLGLFGIDSVPISARAVGQKTAAAVPLAIFAYESDCSEFGFGANGEGMRIEGGIVSNGGFKVNGKDFYAAHARGGGPNGCSPYVNGENIKFGEDDEPSAGEELLDWPIYFYESDFTCTYSAKKFEFNTHGQTIPAGVYCAEEAFIANADNQTGKITVLAPEIRVNGNNQRFEPYAEGLLFFATGTKELELVLNGGGFDWTGIIFHPRGRVKLNGDSYSVLRGLIEGLDVEVNGNGFQMHGTGQSSDEEMILVE